MAKRKGMGEATKGLFPKRTGRQALAEVTGQRTPVARNHRESFLITNVRLRQDQVAWLRFEAATRANANGGKPDSSEVMRELIDERMAARES